ncbi:MAG: mechanosensitive ion channel [Deltaproteobacteria bacterium]|nr:mechanosensitive ion channel [Deltaproteobacteria bacterium]
MLLIGLALVGLLAAGPASSVEPAVARTATDPVAVAAPSTAPGEASPGATGSPAVDDLSMIPRAARRRGEASLVAVLAARRQVEVDLRELQGELRSEAAGGRETEIQARIQARADELNSLSRSFSELATGVDPQSLDAEPDPVRFELSRELRVLLAPLLNELKRATSRPREIDRLRTEITDLSDQLATIERAVAQLDTVAKATKDAELAKALASERKDWLRRRAALATTLEVAHQKLDQRAADSPSIGQAIHDVFQVFFKSRGRNLLLAFVAMASFLFLLRRLRSLLARQPRFTARVQTFGGRIFSLVYSVFTVVGAVLVFVLALYFFGDWVLLILALLLILGLVWASKQALPRFWSQAVLFLDMGAVREGQRVMLHGLPWRVESIAFYCALVNPALVGGRLRLPIEDLGSMRSRPDEPEEPWFPTQTGDVVLRDDQRPAVVEFQSIEVVRLRCPGGNRIVIPTAQFAGESIEVLSGGYRVDVQFGLDYESQAEITTTTREMMETEIERRWRESPWAGSLLSVAVEFSSAGPSSLDYFVRVDLDGSQALDYAAQRRHLASLCVDVCNENGWVIPFPQLTIHAGPARPGTHPAAEPA